MIRRNKFFMVDLLSNVKEYMKRYECSFIDSIADLDHPITHEEVRELAKMAGETIPEEKVLKLGHSSKAVSEYEVEEQRDFDYERGNI